MTSRSGEPMTTSPMITATHAEADPSTIPPTGSVPDAVGAARPECLVPRRGPAGDSRTAPTRSARRSLQDSEHLDATSDVELTTERPPLHPSPVMRGSPEPPLRLTPR